MVRTAIPNGRGTSGLFRGAPGVDDLGMSGSGATGAQTVRVHEASDVNASIHASGRPLRVAILIKQVPRIEEIQLDEDGRLIRTGLELEMNPYCRRAVTAGVRLAQETAGRSSAFTLGPPSAEEILREAIAWGADDGVLITDPAFAGSDTLATARSLLAALHHRGQFDLVITGRNSVDADTGQVGPQLAELLGWAFVGGARTLEIQERSAGDQRVLARVEQDDGWADVEGALPAVVSCAERLCQPCKVDLLGRAVVPSELITRLTSADFYPGQWGQEGSRTRVGGFRVHEFKRKAVVLIGTPEEQVECATQLLEEYAEEDTPPRSSVAPRTANPRSDPVLVVTEPDRDGITRELLGAAARVGWLSERRVTASVPADGARLRVLGAWGADHVVLMEESYLAADVAAGIDSWADHQPPWAILLPSTMWGREVAGRLAARLVVRRGFD